MKNWIEARNQFQELDGNKFGAVLCEQTAVNYLLEWRIRKSDNKICIIKYDISGKYQIYAAE